MKRLVSLMIVAALVFLCLPPPAASNPWPTIPAGYRMGKAFMMVSGGSAAPDTFWFSMTRPTGSAAAQYIGPQTIPNYDPDGARMRYYTRPVQGVLLGAKSPFRLKLYWTGGTSLGTTHVLVDTVQAARGTGLFSVAFPCLFTGVGQLDSMRATPAANDTVWGVTIHRIE